jgi:hydroxymethylbilane synthase
MTNAAQWLKLQSLCVEMNRRFIEVPLHQKQIGALPPPTLSRGKSVAPHPMQKYPFQIATRGSALALAQANHVRDLLRAAFPKLWFEIKIIKTTGDKRMDISLATRKPLAKTGRDGLLGRPNSARPAVAPYQDYKGGYAPTSIDKGLFTKEIEIALMRREADLAVHSLKDLPTTLPSGLFLAATPKRADARDVLIYRSNVEVAPRAEKKLRKGESLFERLAATGGDAYATNSQNSQAGTPVPPARKFAVGTKLTDLPQGAVVATSSLRRRAQVLAVRPDMGVEEIRGNVETRLRKFEENGKLDAMILAAAGLERLQLQFQNRVVKGAGASSSLAKWDALIAEEIEMGLMLPAAGQAAIGIEARVDDERMREILGQINHFGTFAAVTAERALLRGLGGGCATPIAAFGEYDAGGKSLKLSGAVFSLDGKRAVKGEMKGKAEEAEKLGEELAKELLAKGAAELLKAE